jgi:tetratricopeptide (TPR) repeat protein
MLFDLTGKRKRFLQIIFGLLAAIFAISFVGFGIGSGAGGGLFDAVGVGGGHGGGGNSPRNPQFEQQIEDAEAQLASNPTDEQALLDIARARFLAGQDQSTQDEQGNIVVSDEAATQFEGAVQAWSDYIDLEPAELDTDIGRLVLESYIRLNDAGGAAEVQRLFVAADPSSRTYGELALYLYSDGKTKQAEKAADEAIAAAPKDERAGVRSQLEGIAEQAEQALQAAQDGDQAAPLDAPGGAGGHDGG